MLVLLALLLILLVVLLSPIFLFPAGFALGAWLFRSGLIGFRDAIAAANTPTARVGSAALGLVEIEGLATTPHPSPAAVTGRPSVWWDVAVEGMGTRARTGAEAGGSSSQRGMVGRWRRWRWTTGRDA